MATETVDSHQASISEEQTVKSSSEAVKVTEQINLSAPQESVEDDREKGQADNLQTPVSTLSTSEKKAEDIQEVEPAVIEVKKTDETPVVDLPVHDNVKLEKESIPYSLTTTVAEVVAADETQHKENPSTEPVGGEATEPPVIASLEKCIEEFDATDNVKSPPEEQPTAELINREALEVPATASAQKVQEQTSAAVGLPKLEVESSDDTVNSQEKEKPAVAVQSVIGVPEKVEIVSVPVEEVEEKKPKITENPELSVVADSGKGPAEEQPATQFVSVKKEPNKEPETCVPEESVEPAKREVQPIEVLPVKEPVELVVKNIIEKAEPPTEKKQPVEVHPVKGLEEAIAKEISEPIEVSKEKEQASEVDPEEESRKAIETRISESVEVPKENELLVEVHPEKELVVIAKETSESIEPLKNKEQPDEVLFQKEPLEVIEKEVSASFEPPKNKDQADEGFPVTESGEVKEKESSDSTLGSEEVEKQEHEVIEVKDGIRELHEITQHVQDTYVEVETVKDEKALAPGDDISSPIEGGKIHEEEAQHTVESDKQDSVGQVAKSDPIEDPGKGPAKEQPATEFVSVEKEPKEEPETTFVPEESVEPHKKEAQLIEDVPVKEPVEVIAKVVIETVESPTEKEQPLVISKETSESIEPLKNKEQPDQPDEVLSQRESIEIIAKEVITSFDPPKNKEQADEGFTVTESGKGLEKEQADKEFVSVGKELKEEPETTPVPDLSVEPPKKEEQPIEVLPVEEQVEMITKELIETVKPPKEKEQPIEVHPPKGSGEVMEKEITEPTKLPKEKEQTAVHPVQELEVIAEETCESIEPSKNKEQPSEVLSKKESGEVIAKEIGASFEPPKNKEQADEGFPVTESGEVKEKETSDSALGSEVVEKLEHEVIEGKDGIGELPEITKHVQDTYVEVETVKDEKALAPGDDISLPIEGGKIQEEEAQHSVESDKQDSVGPVVKSDPIEDSGKGLEKEQPAKEFVSVDKEPREEPETTQVPELSVEPPKKEEQPIEVLLVKEQVEVIAKEIIETIEPQTEKEQPSEVLSKKESGEVIAKEISASFEPPKNKEQTDEGFPVKKFGEVKEKETSDSTLGSEEAEKLEREVIEGKDGIGELPEITKHVQDTYVEVETVKDEKALAPGDDISPPIEGGKIQEEEAQHSMESDKQDSVGPVAKSDPIEDSGKGLEKEQPAKEFVSVDKEPREEPETTHDPELSVEPPKKEEQPIEVLLVKEQVEVIAKEIIGTIEPQTEKEQPVEVHPLKGSGKVMEKEITKSIELPMEKEQEYEVHPVQESKEVIAEKIGESVEVPKEKELLIEVHPVKELEVIADGTSESIEPPKNKKQPNEVPPEKESGDVIAKEISESFVPPKNKEQADEGFPETSGSTLGSEEAEKQEPEVAEVKDGKEELPEITNHVQNNYVEVETEAIVKGEKVKGEKSLAFRDDIMPPLVGGQIHKEEEQYTVESDRQDSLDQVAQPIVELAARDFSPQDVEEKTSNENETKETSNINVVAKLSKVEAKAVEKVGEENEEKIVKTDKADEDKYEKMEELTLPREEAAPRDSEADAVVAEKSTDDQKTGEEVDLIAETKIEESIKDEKPALVETDNAEHVEGKFNVNETTKELQESEVKVKDKETMITSVEIPKVNDKKEVPSKASHKHSHNILSKVKQSLVKAKKAIIGKSPSSKTLSSEARDNIKVK